MRITGDTTTCRSLEAIGLSDEVQRRFWLEPGRYAATVSTEDGRTGSARFEVMDTEAEQVVEINVR